jgi:uncharacterized protein
MHRLTERQGKAAMHDFDGRWAEIDIVEVERSIVVRAARFAASFDLRGYDTIHCATAEQAKDADLVVASGDKRLLDAWSQLDIATFDVNR